MTKKTKKILLWNKSADCWTTNKVLNYFLHMILKLVRRSDFIQSIATFLLFLCRTLLSVRVVHALLCFCDAVAFSDLKKFNISATKVKERKNDNQSHHQSHRTLKTSLHDLFYLASPPLTKNTYLQRFFSLLLLFLIQSFFLFFQFSPWMIPWYIYPKKFNGANMDET